MELGIFRIAFQAEMIAKPASRGKHTLTDIPGHLGFGFDASSGCNPHLHFCQ
jgi:hypothetical protein